MGDQGRGTVKEGQREEERGRWRKNEGGQTEKRLKRRKKKRQGGKQQDRKNVVFPFDLGSCRMDEKRSELLIFDKKKIK
ncbi:unnamed protein product [Angiostrongylus costaricensis]|uniref:Uncharacterized protein n=1 Tax=Angiostrongylus costaricensis TaxID=334426 RepID=A0A0R3PGR8_ANGCS|nr:unnamed protein product [Angiostrongylus costaricensis]